MGADCVLLGWDEGEGEHRGLFCLFAIAVAVLQVEQSRRWRKGRRLLFAEVNK